MAATKTATTEYLADDERVTTQQANVVRRRELSSFLRSRRERITPDQVGLPPLGRRRTPGLRREEVAQLARVGVTWYTWLEQGRDIRASEQVLEAIASTLQLDPHERLHLFTLAGSAEPPMEKECKAISPAIRAMLRKLEPFPAVVRNTRADILAYNHAYNWLMGGGLDDLPLEDRNSVVQCFTNPDWRARLPDWEDERPQVVAKFRAAMAEHVAEPHWKALVKRLRNESSDFDALWNQHEVAQLRNATKRFLHPKEGMLRFDYNYLWFGPRSECQMYTLTPIDEETEAKLPTFEEMTS